jgi:P4 family phage/plasmid primase-like protien
MEDRAHLFLGDTDTTTNFEFSRQAVFLAQALPGIPIYLPRIPLNEPKGIDDCREVMGTAFRVFFRKQIERSIVVWPKFSALSVAILLLEREQSALSSLQGSTRELVYARIVKLCAAAQRVELFTANMSRLTELASAILGIGKREMAHAIREEVDGQKLRARTEAQADTVARDAQLRELVSRFGPPAHINKDRELVRINEAFWAGWFAAEYQIIHAAEEERFYVYNPSNGVWERRTVHAIKLILSERIRRAAREWNGYHSLALFDTEPQRRDIVALLRGMVEQKKFFENRPWAIHTQNTMMVLEDRRVRPVAFSPTFRSRNQLSVAYDPSAECKRFHQELLEPAVSAEDATLLQKMLGLMVLGINRPQRIFILSGAPNTGKTTLGRLITNLIGVWNYAELRTEQLAGRFETSRAYGKTLLFGPDVKANFLQSAGAYRLKSLVGGDPMDGEKKNSNEDFPFAGDLNALITTNCKLLVRLQGDYGAWYRRLIIIQYDGQAPAKRIDQFHRLLLETEGSGILNWAIEGLVEYEKDHGVNGDIALTEAQQNRVSALLSESDGLRQFLSSEIVDCGEGDLSSDEIVGRYAGYAKARGWRPLRATIVQTQVRDLLFELFGVSQSHSLQRDGEACRGYRGLRFREPGETDPEQPF